MDETPFARSLKGFASASDRRHAVHSLSAAAMALLAALGLAGGEARKRKGNGGNHQTDHQPQAEKKGGKGKRGPTGPTGPQGPAGSAGGSAQPKIRVGEQSIGGGVLISIAHCEAGEHAVGGGALYSGVATSEDVHIRPYPLVAGGTPTGWQIQATGQGAGSGVEAYAVCVPD